MSETASLTPEILPFGPDGVVLRLGLSPDERVVAAVQVLRAALENAALPGVEEIAASLTSVLVRFDPARVGRAMVERAAAEVAQGVSETADGLPDPKRRWTIPVAFGGEAGPQLAEVAQAAGLSEAKAVEALIAAPLRVLAIGFAPGLPYLGLLPPEWDIPRMTDLTPTVPRGALVAAVRQLVLFTHPSPTGWRQVGRAAFHGFDPARDPAIYLAPGDEIRLERIGPSELDALEADNGDGLGGATCQVLR